MRLPRTVRLLIAARVVNSLGAFSLSFLTVMLVAELGATPTTAGLVTAAFGLATIPSRLFGGHLADRLGRRMTIVVGLTGCAVAQVGLAAAGSVQVAAGFAVLLGLFFEIYEPPSQAMIADLVGPSDRARAYSLFNAALAAAGMAAGLIAAGLGRWDLRWLFVVDALTCTACALVVHLALPRDRPTGPAVKQDARHSPWRDRALVAMLVSGTLLALVYMQVLIAVPMSLGQRGLEVADAGLLSTLSALTVIAGQPLLRVRRVAGLSATAALAIGYLLMAAGLAGYALAHTLVAFLAATLLVSLGNLLMFGRTYALVAELAPEAARGRYLAVYGLSWGVATVVAPITSTQLLVGMGAAGLWGLTAALCVVLAAAQVTVMKPLLARRALSDPPRAAEAVPQTRSRRARTGP